MQVRDLRDQAARFVQVHGLEASPEVWLLGLGSEVGEVAKEVLRSADYGRVSFRPGRGWEDELGDALFALVCLANTTGVDLEACFEDSQKKHESRLEARGDAGSAG